MNKQLYYVIEKTVSSDGETLDGLKVITLYEIEENVPKMFASIDSDNSVKTVDAITEWLDDNGYGDEVFDFVQL